MSDPRPNEKQLKRRLYEIWLSLGNVDHVLGNECDPGKAQDLLEPVMEQLEEMWK